MLNELVCVGTGKVAEVECIMHFSDNFVYDKQHPIDCLTGNARKEERKIGEPFNFIVFHFLRARMLFHAHLSIPFHLQLEISGIIPGETSIENIDNMHKKKFAAKNTVELQLQ